MVRTEIRVIYGDTDRMGVVYYANYLRYFEAGRTEFLRAKGLSYRDFEERARLLLPVAEAGVVYHAPARYDDLIGVETSLTEVRRASARFGYRVTRGAELLASGHTLHACVDLDGRIQRMPRELLDRLRSGEDAMTTTVVSASQGPDGPAKRT
jgi:acyl-CoA thioester hydrolase